MSAFLKIWLGALVFLTALVWLDLTAGLPSFVAWAVSDRSSERPSLLVDNFGGDKFFAWMLGASILFLLVFGVECWRKHRSARRAEVWLREYANRPRP